MSLGSPPDRLGDRRQNPLPAEALIRDHADAAFREARERPQSFGEPFILFSCSKGLPIAPY
jgi:hypothetical protein